MPGAARLKERVLKLPLSVSFASMFVPVLIASLCGCPVAAAKPASAQAASAHSQSATSLLAFAARIGVSCEIAQERLSCIGGKPEVGDYYDVDLHPGCGADGWFARVVARHGADLRDRIAPIDRRTIATLLKDQPLCIEAVGRSGGHASYYYVQQLPSGAGLGCPGDTCTGPGKRLARAFAKPPCAIASGGRPNDACSAGWIRAEAVKRTGKRQ